MRTLAIDPGSTESGWVIIDADRKPLWHGKNANEDVLGICYVHHERQVNRVAIEMVASYGMPVGREVFETVLWTGRFVEALALQEHKAELVYRREVKLHHCGSSKAKDSNIRQALCDRFAPGESNYGKGSKAAPGFFYGFKADVWAAFALAVYVADLREGYTP